jgi:acetyl esterase/lipase
MSDYKPAYLLAILVVALMTACPRADETAGQVNGVAAAQLLVGQIAPEFSLKTPAGQTLSLTTLRAGKPLIVEFGSLSSPAFRAQIAAMEQLKQTLGDRACFLVVYTLEAHPTDVPSPYSQGIWVTERNQREGVLVTQPTTYEERVALAERLPDLGVTLPIVVDNMDNAVWEAWGRRSNGGFVVGPDGRLLRVQAWIDPVEIAQSFKVGPPPPLAEVPPGAEARLGVEYGLADGMPLLLDAYTPAGTGPFPAVVMFHGGGWKQGGKTDFNKAVPTYLAQGLACFAVNYRLSDEAPYPAAVEDCVAAVRWVRQHAAEFKVDPDRLAALGGSAGGHLALMVASAPCTEEDVDSEGQPLASLVQAVVSISGPTDLRQPGTGSVETPPLAGALGRNLLPQVIQFLGGRPKEIPQRYAEASPLTRVTENFPPTLLMYGLDDNIVPPSQGAAMAQRLREVGAEVVEMPLAGRGHGLALQYTLPEILTFLTERLNA